MTRLIDVRVPDIGDFKDIPIIEILVTAGQHVMRDSPLVVLESEKATLDVPSPVAGIVKEMRIAIGDRVSVGSILMTMDSASAEPSVASIVAIDVPAPPEDKTSELGSRVVSITATRIESQALPQTSSRSAYASPTVRRMSREFGIDLRAVRGTGPRGRILKIDLQQFVKANLDNPVSNPSPSDVRGLSVAPWPVADFAKFGEIERTSLSKLRKVSGINLSRNSILIPHVTNFDEADITDLESFRNKINTDRGSPTAKLTILPFLIKAAAASLLRYPTFNASLDKDELVLKRYVHIGFAVDTPNGLIVPVIPNVDRMGILEIAATATELACKARDGKLKPTDMQGGCFTISSLGGVGGTGFTPIINAPEVAILGAARAQMRPLWSGSEFLPRLMLPLSLSWDHRVVDGVAAARFLVYLTGILSDFRRVAL